MSMFATESSWANKALRKPAAKRLLAVLCALGTVCAMAQPAMAEPEDTTRIVSSYDEDDSTPVFSDNALEGTRIVDSFTGEVVSTYGSIIAGKVQLTGTASYDPATGKYHFTLPGGKGEVTANIMDGMITTDKVRIEVPENLYFELYHDGKPMEQSGTELSQRGSYVLNYKEGSEIHQVLTFRIIGKTSGELESYPMPSGFRVISVTRDDGRVHTERDTVDLTAEGRYEIVYQCTKSEVEYRLNVRVDHTPPTITLDGVVDGVARGPVQIVDVEEGATVQVLLEGVNLGDERELVQSGQYVVGIMDAAGNIATQQFTILVYFNMNSLAFFLILLGGALACIIYAVTARKRLRVR